MNPTPRFSTSISSPISRHVALACLGSLMAVLLVSTGCMHGVIEDSPVVAADAEIDDTPENREIVDLIDVYRQAMEDKDFGTLRRIISSDYYENGGTSHTTADDYGYSSLIDVFEAYSETVRQLRLAVLIQEIHIQGDRANVYVDFGYNMLYVIDGVERWHVDNDLNRIELVREAGEWRIVAGL